MREKYGLKPFDINQKNIHLFDEENFEKFNHSKYLAYFSPSEQGVIYKETKNDTKIRFAHIVYHEMLHFKNFQKIAVFDSNSSSDADAEKTRHKNENEKLAKNIPNAEDIYRSKRKEFNMDDFGFQHGIRIALGEEKQKKRKMGLTKDIPNAEDFCNFLQKNNGKEFRYGLVNLDEALVEEQTIRFQKKLRDNPNFKEEMDLIDEYIAQENKIGKKINADDIMSARKKTIYDINNEESYILEAELASYKEAREILNILIDKLYENNKNDFQDREEIFDLMVESSFTGNLVGEKSWARLIDKTFGKNTFQKLAETDEDVEKTYKLKKIVENLKPIAK